MKKYRVHLTAISSATVEIEAENPEEALEKAYDETDGYAETEFSDWDIRFNEVEDCETDATVMIDNEPVIIKKDQ